jgi:hypothetical protein
MRGRTVLFVVLAVVMALGGVYIGWSTSSPKAAAEAPATPPSSVRPAQEAGSTRSRSPGTAAPKGSADKGTADKGTTGKGTTGKEATESGGKPAPPPRSQAPRPTGPVSFGKVTTAGRPNETGISDDRRALTTGFSEFEVIIGPASAEPSATKSFSMTLPLTDGANGDVVGFHVSGWSITNGGATARMTLRGGGKVRVREIPTDSDVEIVESLWLPATPGTTYQLSVVIEIHKPAAGGGDGFINTSSLEIGIS